MKRIKNECVRLPVHLHEEADDAGIAVIDTSGVFTTTAHFLCGKNPWGLHQDYKFSSPMSEVRRGARIVAAAEKVLSEDSEEIELSEEDHSVLLSVLADPNPSNGPMSPDLARAVLPIIETIEYPQEEEDEPNE